MPTNSGYYEAARRGIDDAFTSQSASNAYSRTLSQMRGTRDLNDMGRQFQRQLPQYTSTFAQRGFGPGVNSGVMQQQMQQYVGDFNRNYMQGQQDLQNSLNQYDLQSAQLASSRNSALADLELTKAQEIANAARNLEYLRALLGGA